MVLFNVPSFRVGRVSPRLYELPRYEVTLTEKDGYNFVFNHMLGVCVALEIENTGTSDLEFSIDSRSGRKIKLAPQASKGYDNTTIDSIHVHTAGATFVIRAQLVPFDEIAAEVKRGGL